MKPFNRSSMSSDGSGRDTYIIMEKHLRDGRAERKDQANWMPNLRSPPPHRLPHMKGYGTWYKHTQRAGHWSPPASLRSAMAQGEADLSLSCPPADAPGDKGLRKMLKRTSSSLLLRSKPAPGPFLSSTASEPGPSWGSMSPRGRAAGRATSLAGSARIDQALLDKATSTFRLRQKPQAAAYSFGRPASLPSLG
mmetsp:Transcript_117041/g.342814  ORF Transcript_117041/g.342814 Transcript_117041/m.342814 type:complete len:194 (-) Transcript_117041:51-632(-)